MKENPLTLTGPGNITIASPITSTNPNSTNGSLTKSGTGTLTLTGIGSSIAAFTNFNGGTTLIQGADSSSYASLTQGNSGTLGFNSSDNGTLTVSGTNGSGTPTSWNVNTSDIVVGLLGTGVLNITGGAMVSSGGGHIGYAGSANGTVNISGTSSDGIPSTWKINGSINLYVGGYGMGALNITGGALVSSQTAFIGADDSSGTASVSGTNGSGVASTWTTNNNNLTLGYYGVGILNITNGGKVLTGSGTTSLSNTPNSAPTLNINGGSLTTNVLAIGDGTAPILMLTNPSAANGGGYALNLGGSNGSSTIGAAISDAAGGAGGIDKTGIGVLTLNAANTFSGGMQIGGGSVVLGNSLALQNSTVTINTNDGLNLNALSSVTLGGLAGSGNLSLGSTSLTVGGNNAGATYIGVLTGTNTSATFTKTGTGTLTLTGTGNSLAGTPFFNNGTVLIQGATGSRYASLSTSASNAYIGFSSGNNGTVTVSGTNGNGTASSWTTNGHTLTIGYQGAGTLNITSGGKVLTGSGTTILSNLSGSSATLNINGGSLMTNSLSIGSGATPTILLTNPSAANGGGYALNLGGSNGDTTLNVVIKDAAGGAGGSIRPAAEL